MSHKATRPPTPPAAQGSSHAVASNPRPDHVPADFPRVSITTPDRLMFASSNTFWMRSMTSHRPRGRSAPRPGRFTQLALGAAGVVRVGRGAPSRAVGGPVGVLVLVAGERLAEGISHCPTATRVATPRIPASDSQWHCSRASGGLKGRGRAAIWLFQQRRVRSCVGSLMIARGGWNCREAFSSQARAARRCTCRTAIWSG